jgi:hypothetical protein
MKQTGNNLKPISTLKAIKMKLQCVKNSCQEAIDGTWDKSDSGFEAMQYQLDEIAKLLGMELN